MALGLALSGLGALAKLTSGIFQGIKANKIDKNNIRPVQTVQNEYLQNVSDAEQAARIGMPLQQYQQAQQNQQRNFNGVTTALGRSANPSAGLAGLLRASNDAALNLDVQNAQQRVQNQRYLGQQRGILGQQKNNAFDWNQKSKFLAQAAKAQALRGAGAQNLMGAFGDVSQMGMLSQMNAGGETLGNTNTLGGLTPSANPRIAGTGMNFFDAMRKYGTQNNGYNGTYA